MTEQIERHLRDVFSQEAERAPAVGSLAVTVVKRVRRRRRLRLAGTTSVAVAAVVAVAVFGGLSLRPDPGTSGRNIEALVPAASPSRLSAPGTPSRSSDRSGVLPDAAADCPTIDVAWVAARAKFAFDGTISAVVPQAVTSGHVVPSHATVTFTVNEWFRGGSGHTATVTMSSPVERRDSEDSDEWGPSYAVGTRLLVSGTALSGSWGNTPLAGVCGLTRYHDQQTAAAWREAISGR